MRTHAKQVKTYGPKTYSEGGRTYRITARVRFDDECGNGHNTFSITADIDEKRGNQWCEYSGGCCHKEVAKHFPELAGLLKWHLCAWDGPMHYVANTVYHAGDKDCYGLRAGESRQIHNGKTGLPCWILESPDVQRHVDAKECPPSPGESKYVPLMRVGEGKARDLDAARSCAVWPDASDADLTAPGLKERLEARLPALLEEFRAAVESIGMEWSADEKVPA